MILSDFVLLWPPPVGGPFSFIRFITSPVFWVLENKCVEFPMVLPRSPTLSDYKMKLASKPSAFSFACLSVDFWWRKGVLVFAYLLSVCWFRFTTMYYTFGLAEDLDFLWWVGRPLDYTTIMKFNLLLCVDLGEGGGMFELLLILLLPSMT